jgi:hypothetical protein
MDLHLLAPGGTLLTETDCYYANCTPSSWTGGLDWGVIGDDSDDPELVLDDIALTGPEVIVIDAPSGGEFTVVVHDYPGSVFTAGNVVTLEVSIGGESAFTDTWLIEGEDIYTELVSISFPGGVVTSLGTVVVP